MAMTLKDAIQEIANNKDKLIEFAKTLVDSKRTDLFLVDAINTLCDNVDECNILTDDELDYIIEECIEDYKYEHDIDDD